MTFLITEPDTVYVIAEGPAVAENAAKWAKDRNVLQAYQRWANQPPLMQSRFRLYGVRVPA